MNAAQAFIAELAKGLQYGGTDGQLTRSADPQAPAQPVRFLLSHPTRRDEIIVNAYGINALVLTFPASPELVGSPPAKFDLITVSGQKPYALESVLHRQVGNVLVAFTAYVRGKGE